jgi:hypothetical protein
VVANTLKSRPPLLLDPKQVSGHNLDCELVQYNCGKIDGSGNDGPGAVPVYMHVLRMTLPANSVGAMAYRPILEKPPANGIDKSKPIYDWLFAENWALEKACPPKPSADLIRSTPYDLLKLWRA